MSFSHCITYLSRFADSGTPGRCLANAAWEDYSQDTLQTATGNAIFFPAPVCPHCRPELDRSRSPPFKCPSVLPGTMCTPYISPSHHSQQASAPYKSKKSAGVQTIVIFSMLPFVLFVSLVAASQWDTYPSVPKSASINGFADPIYDKLPECAKSCVTLSTKSTPCPYWDTGCFCVMPQWSGIVGACFAKNCKGEDVASATSLAYSLCEKVGANIWIMPASVSTELSSAAGTWQVAAATTKSSDFGDNGKLSSVIAAEASETSTKSASSQSQASGSAQTSSATSGTSSAASSNSTNSSSSGSASSSSSDSGAGIAQTTGIAACILLVVLSFIH